MKSLTKIITISIIGAAASILLVWFVIRPILAEVIASNQEVRDKKIELATLDQQIRAFKTAQADLANATRKDEITNAIVPKESLVAAVLDLERAAIKTGTEESLEMKEADPGLPKAEDVITGREGVDEVRYLVTTLNDYAGTINFLSYLEHLPHFTEIAKINLSAETTQSSTSNSQVRTGRVLGSFDGVFFIKIPQQ